MAYRKTSRLSDYQLSNEESERLLLFEAALDALSQGVALYRSDGTLLYGNPKLSELLGLPPDDVDQGADYFRLLKVHLNGTPIASHASSIASCERSALCLTPDLRQLRIQHRPLGQDWFLSTYERLEPPSAPKSELLIDSGQSGPLSGSLQGVLVHVDNRVVYANDRLAKLLDYAVDEIVGLDVEQLIHVNELDRVRAYRGNTESLSFELQARKRDGSPLWMEAFAYSIEWNGLAARQVAMVDIEERKRAQETLKESERRLRDFAEAGSDWFWETDSEHKFIDFSENVEAALGLSREAMIGRNRLDLLLDIPRTDAISEHMMLLEARKPFRDFTYCLQSARNEAVWVRTSGVPVYHDDGSFRGYRGVGANVTHEINFRAETERARSQLIAAIDNTPTGIALYDVDDRLIFANEAYRRLDMRNYDRMKPGMTFEELVRLRLEAKDMPDAAGREEEWLRERMEAHRNPGPPITVQIGDDTWWLVAEQRLKDGGTVVMITNTTAEKQAELALRDTEHRFREIIEGSVQSIIIHRKGNILYANDAAKRLHGYDGDELIGMTVFDLVVPEGRARMMGFSERRQAGLPVPDVIEYECLRKDGSTRWIELVGRLIEWQGEAAIQITEIDITERFLSQEALRAAKEQAEQANRVKSQFLANMSHELRTPLNAIVGFSDMIEQEMLGPIAERRYVAYAGDIKASGEHLLAIINDILDLSRVEVGQAELEESGFALHDAIASCVRLIQPRAEQAGLKLNINVPADLPDVYGDQRRIKQIAINLLSNAVKFTPVGGTISIDAAIRSDDSLALSVTDSGIGMAPEDIERALQPFVQLDTSLSRKFEGTGLGLALCRMLADMHESRLEIVSESGNGTTVSLILPPERILR